MAPKSAKLRSQSRNRSHSPRARSGRSRDRSPVAAAAVAGVATPRRNGSRSRGNAAVAPKAAAVPNGAAALAAAASASVAVGPPAGLVGVFGYGSNGVPQLRGRLESPDLYGYPGRIPGYATAFAGPNYSWMYDCEDCGTATLIQDSDETALGTVVYMTEEQIEVLDRFEGFPFVYDRREFAGQILRNGTWVDEVFVAYIKVNSTEWYQPSEAYRCAVMFNVGASHPDARTVALRDCEGLLNGHWVHPGFAGLGLGAFMFEVLVRREQPPALPMAIRTAQSELDNSGVSTIEQIAENLASETAALCVCEEDAAIIRRLLSEENQDEEGSWGRRFIAPDAFAGDT